MKEKILASLLSIGLLVTITSCDKKEETRTEQNIAKENTKIEVKENKEEKDLLKISENSLDKLKSYKMKIKVSWENADGTNKVSSANEMSFSKENNAKHIKTSGELLTKGTSFELITIGSDSWMNMNGTWIKAPSVESNETVENDYKDALKTLNETSSNYKYIAKEKINGIDCKKYSINGEYQIPLPEVSQSSKEANMKLQSVKIKGDVWIATDDDIKDVVIKEASRIEGNMVNPGNISKDGAEIKVEKTIMTTEREITDINTSIKIEAPKGAKSIMDSINMDEIKKLQEKKQ